MQPIIMHRYLRNTVLLRANTLGLGNIVSIYMIHVVSVLMTRQCRWGGKAKYSRITQWLATGLLRYSIANTSKKAITVINY